MKEKYLKKDVFLRFLADKKNVSKFLQKKHRRLLDVLKMKWGIEDPLMTQWGIEKGKCLTKEEIGVLIIGDHGYDVCGCRVYQLQREAMKLVEEILGISDE